MDAVAPALIGIGIWLAYEAWTNPQPHPLQNLTSALGASSSGGGADSTINSAPYTGAINSQGLGQGTSVAGGGTGAIHG